MENINPLVSIILPVYNGETTLKDTLQSLVSQTYTHFELLIGIDGTTDGSKAIAESFQDARIKIFEHPVNLGLAENVNSLVALTSSESDLIAMAEQDDIYVPERLQWQVEVMQNHPEVGLVSGITVFLGDNGQVLFPGILMEGHQFPQREALFKYLYENQLKVVNTCMMFKKSVHKSNQLKFQNTYGNYNVDWNYVLRFSLVSQVYGIPRVLVYMNRKKSHKSVTSNKSQQFIASRQLLKDFKAEFPNLVTSDLYHKALKQHRKIELGYRNKIHIILYGCYYSLIYGDIYFLKYIGNRTLKFFSNKHINSRIILN